MPDYMTDAEPFFASGNSVGCLLIHGLTGTPYEMRGLGERLQAAGYTVSGPALAGHATRLADMVATRWQDWYATVTDAYDTLRVRCEAIFPIGLSLGGLLALHLAAHRRVDGVIAVSPPYQIERRPMSLLKTFPFLVRLIPYIAKDNHGGDTLDPRVHVHHPEYDAYPTACLASLAFGLIPHLEQDLGDVRAPALFIQSHGDHVIPRDSISRFHAHIGSRDKTMLWLDKSGHLVLEDLSKDVAYESILAFIREHLTGPVVTAPTHAESTQRQP